MISILSTMTCTRAIADNNCFIYKDNAKTITDGECNKRHPPQSTFKIAISLMGYSEGILIDETHPMVPFVKGYADNVEAWKQPHNPTLWIENSCVWYSRFITNKLGIEKFKDYIKKFDYGNLDVSGDKGLSNGLSNSWITSSLEISPAEQVYFLEKFLQSKLPINDKAQKYTHNILYLKDLPNGWKLYGKTGTGDLLNKDGTHDTTHERGWFVGWIEKNDKKIIFAQYLEMENIKSATNSFGYVASRKAKELAKEKLIKLTTSM